MVLKPPKLQACKQNNAPKSGKESATYALCLKPLSSSAAALHIMFTQRALSSRPITVTAFALDISWELATQECEENILSHFILAILNFMIWAGTEAEIQKG